MIAWAEKKMSGKAVTYAEHAVGRHQDGGEDLARVHRYRETMIKIVEMATAALERGGR